MNIFSQEMPSKMSSAKMVAILFIVYVSKLASMALYIVILVVQVMINL